MEQPRALGEYEKLVLRMNTPRVVIDNAVCSTATLVKVDSARKHGLLLEAVQVLTDLNLSIKKAYISSDGRWFMDVFHVTDQNGDKLTDDSVLSYIEQSLVQSEYLEKAVDGADDGLTALELTGTDRPGLLSEVCAVLAELQCSVVEDKLWTHNGRIASIIYVKDEHAADAAFAAGMESRLCNVLKAYQDIRGARTAVAAASIAHTERRLHQMMLADRDYERFPGAATPPSVSVQDWPDRGYSIVKVECRDREKLLFDIVCTLTDLQYIVFHATVDTNHSQLSYQEFYIRHTDGTPIRSEAERNRVVLCLQAAIERRSSEGVRLELCTADRPGLLAEVTRAFRENGLSITRAEVSTTGETAKNLFYVKDAGGHPIDRKTIEAVLERIGLSCLTVKDPPAVYRPATATTGGAGMGLLSFGSLVRKNLYNLGLIRSCS